MRARIDISEVEARTKIRAKYLRAIENEEWDLLPGPVYVKSFLRTYGDYLGLDSRLLIDEFKRRYERPTDHELRPIAPTARERDRHRDRAAARAAGCRRGRRDRPRAGRDRGRAVRHRDVSIGARQQRYAADHGTPTRVITTTTTTSTPRPTRSTSTTRAPRRRRHAGHGHACSSCRRARSGSASRTSTGSNADSRASIYNAGQTIPIERLPKLLVTLGNARSPMKVNGRPSR